MPVAPALYRFMESRIASPVWRHATHAFERYRERRVLARNRRRAAAGAAAPLAERFCGRPFESFEVQENGSVYLCCPTWLRQRAGNLHDAEAGAIWNSPAAQAVRRSILDGSFRHCDHETCPEIAGGTLPTRAAAARDPRFAAIIAEGRTTVDGLPAFVNFAQDKSCNLSCPSCRTQRLQFNDGPGHAVRKSLHDRLVDAFLARPTDQAFTLNITGIGDPFASRIFREFLFALDGGAYPNMKVNLQTNGVLLTPKTWQHLHRIHDRIECISVSIDAAEAATYGIVRRGGDWDLLQANLDFLAALRRRGGFRQLLLFFVVQRANFREMPGFVALGKRLGADRIHFSRAVNWGPWSAAEYRTQCVWEPAHPDNAAFAAIIADPVFDDPAVALGNLVPDRRAALARRP